MQKIAILGGDSRQTHLEVLLKKDGYEVISLFGRDSNTNIVNTLRDADVIIFPLPTSRDGITLYAPLYNGIVFLSDIAALCKGKTVLIGGGGKAIQSIFETVDVNVIDYYAREELIIKNALATAEGAISLTLVNTPFTIHGSRCLVVGYGRIGKILSKLLDNMGAIVSVSARKARDLAWIQADGTDGIRTDEICNTIHEYDLIFNTVPTMVLGEKELSNCKADALIIELASPPGGIDMDIANRLGIKIIPAAGLPGKTAPLSSAGYIKETILNILSEG